ncbi:MAG: TetR/AcrR family transcriptional regulator [Phenylobacterium sp.]|uniref:TetR/AcrR family transcriptional regulator n=1 Tax=Phenylobacterium sp. TaxID=1871053 RepID=UPI002733D1B8|nr:TetR/AcrR family transcriptional regulator [Phenylobacterium sp.]MDP3749174.1 TetR/AcrR family transcriptional regulator [Phenylobacterium sp.]
MKHVPSTIEATGETEVRVPTRRALAKQQTRAKVLAAARRLFSEAGYEGATIRDIAAEAGMSTGAVFANFTDKSDLFREIMVSDMEALTEAMAEASSRGRTVEDALLRLFMAGYAFYKTQLPLARAAFSISWLPEQGPELRTLPPVNAIHELITDQLNLGVERGELSQEVEAKLRTQMLFDCYLANYPEAIFQGWSLEALQAKSRDQIRVVLAGARRG